MGKPSAPRPADPAQTAQAQTSMNVNTAIANQILGQTNQVGPNGSLTYRQTGSQTITDPNTGQTYQIPSYTATTRLNPDLAVANRINNRSQVNLAQTGERVSTQLENHFGQRFNLRGARRGGMPAALGAGRQAMVGGGPNLQENIPQGAVRSNYNSGGAIDRTIGNVGGVNGNIAGAGGVQRGIDGAGGVSGNIAGAGAITRSYGTDFSKDRQRVENALMERMNPSLQQDRQALESRLASQGIGIGSQAYQAAMGDFSQQSNDARLGAILAGGEEQSRMVGMERDRSMFQNDAQLQQFGQNAARSQFANDAQAQRYGQNANNAAFANAAQQQQFGQNAARSQFGNDAQQQRFGQEAARSQFNNDAQAQANSQNRGLAEFFNSAQSQRFGQDAQQVAMANAARQGEYDNRSRQVQQNNAARTQGQQNRLTQQQYFDQTRARDIQERLMMRNQPLNEIAALMSGSQVAMPQFGATPQGTVANTDYAGLVANRDAVNQGNYQARLGGWNALMGGIGGGIGALIGGGR